jgi:hypothetical protein
MRTLADLAAVPAELAECRRRVDGALGRSLQLLDPEGDDIQRRLEVDRALF